MFVVSRARRHLASGDFGPGPTARPLARPWKTERALAASHRRPDRNIRRAALARPPASRACPTCVVLAGAARRHPSCAVRECVLPPAGSDPPAWAVARSGILSRLRACPVPAVRYIPRTRRLMSAPLVDGTASSNPIFLPLSRPIFLPAIASAAKQPRPSVQATPGFLRSARKDGVNARTSPDPSSLRAERSSPDRRRKMPLGCFAPLAKTAWKLAPAPNRRHCERSKAAQTVGARAPGLLRSARKDGVGDSWGRSEPGEA